MKLQSARSGSGSRRAPPLRTSLAGPRPAAKPWAPAVAAPCRLPARSCTRGQSPILGGEHLQEEFQSARPIGDTSAPARARLPSRLGETPTPRPLLEAEGRLGPGDQAASEAAPPPGRLRGVPHPGRSIPRRAPRPSSRLSPWPAWTRAHAPHLGEAGRAGAERGDRERPLSPRSRWVGQFRGPRGAELSPAPSPRAAADRGRASARSSSAALAGAPPPRRRPHPPGLRSGCPARPPPARRGKPGASSPAPRPLLSPPPPPRRGTEFALRPAAPLVEAAARPLPRPQTPGSP